MDAFLQIVAEPDNIPILVMLPAAIVLLALWWRVARRNDRTLAEGGETALRAEMEGPLPDDARGTERTTVSRVHTWPYLVRVELLAALVVLVVLMLWSVLIDAPLEQMADPTRTPNPSKAPWYFVGLQEMLVYFDPWIAGVVLPCLIIFGLCAIPYLDVNPRGVGHYSWRERRFAISTFLFGFVGLWLLLIVIGAFCRGPGWHWFWPWQAWDDQAVEVSATRNWPQLFGIEAGTAATVFGGLTMAAYYGLGVAYWFWRRGSETLRRLGLVRYAIVAFLFLTMMGLPIKIALRHILSVKYVWVTPWFNV